MADDVELENPSKKARLDENFGGFVSSDRAATETKQYSTITLDDADFTNQRNVGEGGQTDDEHPETSKSSADPARDSDNDSSVSGLSNLSGLSGEESWKPVSGPMSWVYRQMSSGMDPKAILKQIIPHETQIPDLDDLTLWKLIINIVCEPPPRTKLDTVNTLADVVQLLRTCKNIMVLTGAGVSVSCGIPDFRSRNGVYARLAADYPDLPDPQAMFDIHYFRNDQRPFFKFAKEIFPGQFEPSKCHKFIRLIEDHGKLLRNYTQNIDTLEQVAGISNVIQCHGSFASATCMVCGHKCTADDIKTNIMEQVIPFCPRCPPDTPQAVMKPDIVFFGESLPEEFHNQMAADKEICDLLIVIGSSLKVRPVALIPNSLPPKVPQILINKEPLKNLNFDVELLGDCDTIVGELCRHLGEGWDILSRDADPLTEVAEDQLLTPPATPTDVNTSSKMASEKLPENEIMDRIESTGETRAADRSESCVSDSGIEENDNQTNAQMAQSKPNRTEIEVSTDSNCKCADNNVTNPVELAHKDIGEKSDTLMEYSTTEICGTSELNSSTSVFNNRTAENNEAADNKTAVNNVASDDRVADNHMVTDNSEVVKDKNEDSVSDSKANNSEDSVGVQSDLTHQDVQSSEHKPNQESNDSAAMEADAEVCGTRRTHTCSTSSVCYGDKDTCGCSSDIEELRKMWKPAVVRCSVSKRLGPNQYCFMPPSRYVFPEAEVYTMLEDSDSESDSDKDDLDDLSDIDGNSDPLNTSEEQMDRNNSCSDQDGSFSVSNLDANNVDLGEIIPNSGNVIDTDNVTRHLQGDLTECQYKTDSSQQSDDKNPNNERQHSLLTTSNELSDSLIDNMDHFAKIVTDQASSTEAGSQDFNIDFEGT